MLWGIIIAVTVQLMLLYEGHRAGASRSMGSTGGIILVLLFSWLGLIFVYMSPRDDEDEQEIS
jgi:hypothetical protein